MILLVLEIKWELMNESVCPENQLFIAFIHSATLTPVNTHTHKMHQPWNIHSEITGIQV